MSMLQNIVVFDIKHSLWVQAICIIKMINICAIVCTGTIHSQILKKKIKIFILLQVPRLIAWGLRWYIETDLCVFCGENVDSCIKPRIGTKGYARKIDMPGYKHIALLNRWDVVLCKEKSLPRWIYFRKERLYYGFLSYLDTKRIQTIECFHRSWERPNYLVLHSSQPNGCRWLWDAGMNRLTQS